jgi:transcriptional regulator NrdR family protein
MKRDGPAFCRCGGHSRVLQVRHSLGTTRRRRLCLDCGRRWTTREVEEAQGFRAPLPTTGGLSGSAK